MKVLVLGSGPAGLIAAHTAVEKFGAEVRILSQGRKSDLYGCQYLHRPVAGVPPVATTLVSYELRGTAEDYARKVYGGALPAGVRVSPESLQGSHFAWDIRATYDWLWDQYQNLVHEYVLYPDVVGPLLGQAQADIVISSIPLPFLCQQPDDHGFTSVDCWAMGDAPDRGQRVPVGVPEETVWCDGTADKGFYRAARVFGHTTVEWPGWRRRPPLAGVSAFTKPIATTCTCWQREIVRVGRYGTWTKGVLAHEAALTTEQACLFLVNGPLAGT